MTLPPNRVPVCLVTGTTGTDKRAFIHALAAAQPAAERWAVLDNDDGNMTREAPVAQLTVAAISGCACCTGTVALQVGIVQLIRKARPQRLIIVAAGAAEPAALEHALRQEALARGITVTHRLCVVEVQLLAVLPPSAQDLLQRQISAADHVVALDAAATATLCGAGIAGVIQMEDAIRFVLAAPASSVSSRRIAS